MKRIDTLIKEHLKPLLKKNGFKKRNNLWNRNRGSFVDAIDVQKAKWNTASHECFTLNIGVFVPVFYEAVWGKPINGFAKEAYCVVRCRLGVLLQDELTGKAHDTWWESEYRSGHRCGGSGSNRRFRKQSFPILGFDV